jgi:hypothetical protein
MKKTKSIQGFSASDIDTFYSNLSCGRHRREIKSHKLLVYSLLIAAWEIFQLSYRYAFSDISGLFLDSFMPKWCKSSWYMKFWANLPQNVDLKGIDLCMHISCIVYTLPCSYDARSKQLRWYFRWTGSVELRWLSTQTPWPAYYVDSCMAQMTW